jgi:hypothetical protein
MALRSEAEVEWLMAAVIQGELEIAEMQLKTLSSVVRLVQFSTALPSNIAFRLNFNRF